MEPLAQTGWAGMIINLRRSQGLSQRDLAELLEVDQTSVSRWERGAAIPSTRHRRQMRDMIRGNPANKLDSLAKLRVQMSSWPSTLVSEGAILVEMSRHVPAEVSTEDLHKGDCLYGLFGAEADENVFTWERSGIFSGELAMTVSLNRISTPEGTVYFRGMDTPHICAGGEIWCLCEIRRLSEAEYHMATRQMGGALMSISFDELA